MEKKIFYSIFSGLLTIQSFAQGRLTSADYYDDYEEDFKLTTTNIIFIVIGIILILLAINFDNKNKGLAKGLGCVGLLCVSSLIVYLLEVLNKMLSIIIICAIGYFLIKDNIK